MARNQDKALHASIYIYVTCECCFKHALFYFFRFNVAGKLKLMNMYAIQFNDDDIDDEDALWINILERSFTEQVHYNADNWLSLTQKELINTATTSSVIRIKRL